MYYIAICDDETFTCSAIEQQLLDLSEKANIPMQVDVFYSGNGFINSKNEILNSTTTFGGGIYSRTVKVYSFI